MNLSHKPTQDALSIASSILSIISVFLTHRGKISIPLHIVTFFLGASLAWTACVWLPAFRKKRLLENYKKWETSRRLKQILANKEFMKRFHYVKSHRLNVPLLCNDDGNLVCPECAEQNMEVILPFHGNWESRVVCPRCGHVVDL